MKDIKVTGKQTILGKEIPVVLGGFGEDKKSITDKMVGLLHGIKTKHIRELINRNRKQFIDNEDLYDLKIEVVPNDVVTLCSQLGYTQFEITRSNNLYILSERGYLKLVKIMDNETAWDVYNHLLDEYFYLRDTTPLVLSPDMMKLLQETKDIQALNARTAALKTMLPVYEKVLSDKELLRKAESFFKGTILKLPKERRAKPKAKELTMSEKIPEIKYTLTDIAEKLGIYSKPEKPHVQAVKAIIGKLNIDYSEMVFKEGTIYYYSQQVLDGVEEWLNANDYPFVVKGNNHTYRVQYNMKNRG